MKVSNETKRYLQEHSKAKLFAVYHLSILFLVVPCLVTIITSKAKQQAEEDIFPNNLNIYNFIISEWVVHTLEILSKH